MQKDPHLILVIILEGRSPIFIAIVIVTTTIIAAAAGKAVAPCIWSCLLCVSPCANPPAVPQPLSGPPTP